MMRQCRSCDARAGAQFANRQASLACAHQALQDCKALLAAKGRKGRGRDGEAYVGWVRMFHISKIVEIFNLRKTYFYIYRNIKLTH